ncbi:unnamed protein product [Rotaria socialis]|uniref:G-protein coupled receptors family 1 profile domain-containing protein n=1 Tax=Rotaria socialis TaxID=392032 RepID=A0A818DEK0_9BILA|nr:unnamed protein product [Rotaria socialis]
MNYSNTTMSSRSDATLVATLDDTTFQIIRYGSIFIFLFGTIGNAFNILVLSQSSFRSSPCAQLFLFASVEPFQKDSPQKCYDATVACRYVTDLLFTFLPILPLIPMLVFGLLTIQNVRQSRNRTIPTDVSRVPPVGVIVNFNPTNRFAIFCDVSFFFRLMITGSICYAYVSLPSIDGETNELLKKIFNSFIGGLSSAVDDDDDVDCSLSILLLFDMLLL